MPCVLPALSFHANQTRFEMKTYHENWCLKQRQKVTCKLSIDSYQLKMQLSWAKYELGNI